MKILLFSFLSVSKSMKRYACVAATVLMVVLCYTWSSAQEPATQDTLTRSQPVSTAEVREGEPTDSIVGKKFFSGVELMVDYGKLLLLWTKFESKYAGGVNLRFFERVVLSGEAGYSELNPLKAYEDALYYTVRGSYGRIGLDYYTSYDPSNFYYFGLRYGMSNFADEGEIFIEGENPGELPDKFGSDGITASWMEIVLGTETFLKIGKKLPVEKKTNFILGWNFSVRILTNFENRDEFPIYSIPGYGRTFNNATAAMSFYIKYRIGK